MPTEAVTQLSTSQYYLASRDANNDDVNEAAARLLFLAVRWARTIPSFSNVKFDFKDGACYLLLSTRISRRTSIFYLDLFVQVLMRCTIRKSIFIAVLPRPMSSAGGGLVRAVYFNGSSMGTRPGRR